MYVILVWNSVDNQSRSYVDEVSVWLKVELDEASEALDAAHRLSEQLDRKEAMVSALRDEGTVLPAVASVHVQTASYINVLSQCTVLTYIKFSICSKTWIWMLKVWFRSKFVLCKKTSSSAAAERPCEPLSQLKSCQLLHNCTKNHIWLEGLPFHVV